MTDLDPFSDWRGWQRAKVAAITPDIRERAIATLREGLTPTVLAEVRGLIRQDPDGWATPLHFSWGMGVRNLLRAKGLDARALGGSLDDYYPGLVELAVFGGKWVEEADTETAE